jgi:hypothetical protein
MMQAADVVERLSTNVDIRPPATESQARELAPLKDNPEQLAEAWNEAVEVAESEGRQVTAPPDDGPACRDRTADVAGAEEGGEGEAGGSDGC